jgi:hypothetical protein
MSMARLAVVDKDEARARAAQELLEAGSDAPLRLELRGGPVLRMRFSMALSALQLSKMEK